MSDVPTPPPAPEAPLRRIPFSPRQEASLRALCNWMQVAAVISIVSAVAKLVSAFTPRQNFGNAIDAALTFLIGLWIYQAGTAFRQVANTEWRRQRAQDF